MAKINSYRIGVGIILLNEKLRNILIRNFVLIIR